MNAPNIMLGTFSMGGYHARKGDRNIAAKAEVENHAKAGTVTAAKYLMAGVPEHKAIRDYDNMRRTEWTQITVPWFDGRGAPRAANADAVPSIIVKIGDWERERKELIEAFVRVYTNVVAQRQFEMGDLFDPRQFPNVRDLRHKYYFRTDWCALPKAEDIRISKGMTPGELKVMQDAAIERHDLRIANALNVAAQRLFKVVQAMHATMATPIGEKGAKFNDSKLENILELVELMPILNITGDPKLAEMAKQAKKLATKSPGELREDVTKRANAATEAAALAKKLAGAFDVTATEEEDE